MNDGIEPGNRTADVPLIRGILHMTKHLIETVLSKLNPQLVPLQKKLVVA